ELREEIRLHDPDWERRLATGPAAIQALLRRFRPFSAHRVLRPFVGAYNVGADALERWPGDAAAGQARFLRNCAARGRRERRHGREGRLRSRESVSQLLFATGLRLAQNRELVHPGAQELGERRRAFAEELRRVLRRVDTIDALVTARHAGLID